MRYTKSSSNAAAALIFSIVAALAGCGGSHTRVITAPGYKKQFAINADLAVVTNGAIDIIYRGDALKSLREANNEALDDPRQLIQNYFYAQLMRDIQREIDIKSVYTPEFPTHRFLVTKEVVKTKDEEVKVEIPDVNTRFMFDTHIREPALVLFLDRLRVGTETDPYYADRAQHGIYAAIPRKLVYVGSFVLWDNRENKLISYGRVRSDTFISKDEAAVSEWEEVSRSFVRQIFEVTGFLKRDRE